MKNELGEDRSRCNGGSWPKSVHVRKITECSLMRIFVIVDGYIQSTATSMTRKSRKGEQQRRREAKDCA